jgi:hypothetical protein
MARTRRALFFAASTSGRNVDRQGVSTVNIARPTRKIEWTSDRISALTTTEIQQLRANAERLNDPEIRKRCDAVLSERRKAANARSRALRAEKKLLATGPAA